MSCHIFEVHNVTPNYKITAIKYLGMIFDQNLNFKFHISKVSKKLFFMHFTLFVQQKHLFRKISKNTVLLILLTLSMSLQLCS